MSFFGKQSSFEKEVAIRASQFCEVVISEMGAEIHDDLIQKVSVLKLYLDRLERSAGDPTETLTTTARMRSDLDGVIGSIRAVSRRMLPTLLETDSFEKNISLLCQNMESFSAANIHTEVYGVECPMPYNSKLYLFRIAQELIHNALKHSTAWHIWVRLFFEGKKLTIEVEDDGTRISQVGEIIRQMDKKKNTLTIRTRALGAELTYERGAKGLLGKVVYVVK
jgi:signal transduction histidine kinase